MVAWSELALVEVQIPQPVTSICAGSWGGRPVAIEYFESAGRDGALAAAARADASAPAAQLFHPSLLELVGVATGESTDSAGSSFTRVALVSEPVLGSLGAAARREAGAPLLRSTPARIALLAEAADALAF
jgi:cellulose synthase/poly-beta-1,6-N-acetylglucosamine synthase-like glycosyltransferase